MNPILGKIFGKAGKTLVDSVGKVLDDVITNKEEKAAIKLEVEKEINRHNEILIADASKEFELILKDRDSARNREIEMAKAGKSDWLMKALGTFIILAFGFFVYASVYVNIPSDNKEMFLDLKTAARDSLLFMLAYYWGSSKGSADKTKILGK